MLKIALKDIKLFTTDRRALMMTFFMPIALISIFAMAFGGEKERNARPMNILVSDVDGNPTTKNLITKIDSLKNIQVQLIPTDSAVRLVRTGEESAVLIFKKGFGDSLNEGRALPLEMQFDPSKAAETGMLQQALMSNLMQMVGKELMIKRAVRKAMTGAANADSTTRAGIQQQITANYNSSANEKNPVSIEMKPVVEEKQSSPGLIQAVAGTAVMMLLFGLAAMGAGLLEEKENGTLKRLLYSPMRSGNILLGKTLASNLVALMQLTVLFLYAAFAFHLDLGKNAPALIVMMLTTSYACSGFGMFLASIAKSRQQVQVLSTVLVLSMSAIGGSMIPTFLMPVFMQKLSVVSINYWSIQGFYDIYWRNLAFTDP
ncbi:MAG TPA: ABC transporter permease, partial [Bacteroidia bacterium]|nr:ABC transporter permease [Bacteroidia bacterium]